MDTAVVEKYFKKFPKLPIFIGAGNISLKAAREILDVDRYYMYDVYLELIQAGAIRASSSNTFRATPELKEYLERRRNNEQA